MAKTIGRLDHGLALALTWAALKGGDPDAYEYVTPQEEEVPEEKPPVMKAPSFVRPTTRTERRREQRKRAKGRK